jgi:CheY-like chemotaxis protein
MAFMSLYAKSVFTMPCRVILSLLLIAASLPAQQYSFRYYGAGDGLTTPAVRLIFQDRAGFLWAGTDNGVFRFDGSRFHRFAAGEGLPRESVTSLGESPDGKILAGFRSGLFQLKGSRFEKVALPCQGGFEADGSIQYDFMGRTYFSTTCGLMSAEAPGSGREMEIRAVSGLPGSSGRPTYGLYIGHQAVWYGCGSGICRNDSSGTTSYGESSGLPQGKWTSIQKDGSDNLWAFNGEAFAVLWHGGTRFEKLAPGFPAAVPGARLQSDSSGRLLLPTIEGLGICEGPNSRVISASENLDGKVLAVMQDREGSVWLGLEGKGLARWRGYMQWEGFTALSGLVGGGVHEILMSGNGNVICGTEDGLYSGRKTGAKWVWERNQAIGRIPVLALSAEVDGSLWLCARDRGAARIDARTGKVDWIQAPELSGARLFSVAVDRSQKVWIGAEPGLFAASSSERKFQRVQQIPQAECRIVRAGAKGEILAGTAQGLFVFSENKWKQLSVQEGLLSNEIEAAAAGPDEYWVGYGNSAGVTRIKADGERFSMSHFGSESGLYGSRTSFLGIDSRGWLWKGSDEGVWARSGDDWRLYDHRDGLIQDDCSSGGIAAGSDGSVWVGTSAGLVSFLPRPGVNPEPKLEVVFANLRDENAGSAAPSNSDLHAFRFSVLNYASEGSILYRYRIDPYYKDWRETSLGELQFAGLPPGHYLLQIQARNRAGKWSEKPTEIAFEIEMPWWRTPWFLGGSALGLLLFFYIVWRHMHRRQMEIHSESENAVALRTEEVEKARHRMGLEVARAEKEKKRADDANRAGKEFLVRMSHEMRTPMNGILGMTDLLRESAANPKQREYIEMLRSSAAALWMTINDLMDFSKIEAGKLEWENVDFELRKTIDQVLRPILPHIHRKGLEINRIISPDVPNAVKGDPARLRQVLRHLLRNAVKCTHAGEINLRVHCESLEPDSARLHFTLHDTGLGIDPGRMDHLFEAFQPLSGGPEKLTSGFGVGLSVCHQLVQRMAGRIWAESEPGKGSKFHFTAKFGISQTFVASVAPAEASFDGMRILIVDDNETSRQYLADLLTRWGLRTSSATDGAKALQDLDRALGSSKPYHLVLVDSGIPGMDGLELIRKIKADEGHARLHLVLMISAGRRDEAAHCREIGIKDFITKPAQESRLRKILLKAAGITSRRVAVSAPPEAAPREVMAKPCVLLVEDNMVCQQVASHSLEKYGCRVTVADDGMAALEHIDKQRFDLVLTDLEMPNMDGLETARAIREREKGSNTRIPIIALTSYDMPGDKERCMAAGMDGYLTKPLRSRDLHAMIQNLTAHSQGAGKSPA